MARMRGNNFRTFAVIYVLGAAEVIYLYRSMMQQQRQIEAYNTSKWGR